MKLYSILKNHLDDIFIGGGLLMWAIGLYGLSGTVYLALSFLGIEIMLWGAGVQQKGK